MIINIKDTLTLDDNNDYVVVSKVIYEGKKCYYLLDKNDNTNFKFCYEDKDDLVEIDDKELNTKLLPMFLQATKDILSKQDRD